MQFTFSTIIITDLSLLFAWNSLEANAFENGLKNQKIVLIKISYKLENGSIL
ncbi:MAG: hypothetical protein Q7J16_00080 [Candidatus Cloacimonadales bacterium]|nr:hypothetical protein [Candidatus Cloacimonadales bacterium]